MPRIVPLQLLKCLRVLLDDNGGILSASEVKRIAGLMAKYSKKLVSKCVYVQILKSTKTELLDDFMSVGGWSLVYTWLNDAIRAMNWPLVQEILELLLLSPVDVSRLKINSAPILVKGLCKDGGNEGVRILAKRLVEQWLKIVTENPNATGGNHNLTSAAPTAEATNESSGNRTEALDTKDSQYNENNSSDSTDSGGGPVTVKYKIASAHNKSCSGGDKLVLKLKTVDESAAASAGGTCNDEDSSLPMSETGGEDGVDNTEKSNLDSSRCSATDVKAGDEDADKKHKNSRDKKKSSEKDRDKDRKSSSHRSSSSSHKSSSSSSSSSSKSSSKNSSSSHRSSSEKYREKDKSRSSSSKDKERKETGSSSSSSKHKSSSKTSSSSSSSSSTSSSSKERNREKDKSLPSPAKKEARPETEKDNKLMPPPSAAVLDKKSKESDAEALKPKSIPILSRKASISIEVRRDTEKVGTVKTYQSKFRSHGLTEEVPPPPSRKGLKKPTSTPTPTALPPTLKRPSPPPRDEPSIKKPKIDMNSLSGHVERPGAAKLIAPKKIQTLVETNLFSDALTASIEPKKVVKRKRTAAAASPTEKEAPLAPLKFYQDTLDESKSEDKSDESTKENDESRSGSPNGKDADADDDDVPLKKVKDDIEQKVRKEKSDGDAAEAGSASPNAEEDAAPEEPKKPGPGCGPDGPPGVLMLHRRKGPKKKLTWQPEDKLTQIRYFEVDRSERVNVTKQSFLEMKNMERYSERDALNISRRGFDDIMEPQMEWRPLVEVDNVPDHPNGSLSKQRHVQAEREATTLRALYFSPDMIPDSGAEAEIEPQFPHEIPVIPMDDLTGNPDAVNDYSTLPWPDPKGYAANSIELGYGDNMNQMMSPGMSPNMMAPNPFQPFGNNFMPNGGNMPQMNMNMPANGAPNVWQNQMGHNPMMNPMNAGGMDHGMPPNFMGGQFPNAAPFGPGPGPNSGPGAGPQGFNNMNFSPMMMNNGPMANGMGPMQNGGPRNNNRNNKNMGGGGGGGNWRSGGNNFQDNSGANWRSAGSGSNRGGGGGGGNIGGGGNNNGVCKQFMRGHCHMGKSCKYVHPQKKRL